MYLIVFYSSNSYLACAISLFISRFKINSYKIICLHSILRFLFKCFIYFVLIHIYEYVFIDSLKVITVFLI